MTTAQPPTDDQRIVLAFLFWLALGYRFLDTPNDGTTLQQVVLVLLPMRMTRPHYDWR